MTTTLSITALPIKLNLIERAEAVRMLGAMDLEDAAWAACQLTDDIARVLDRLPDDRGQFRAVWVEGDVVIKVPVCQAGYRALAGAAANAYEAREAAAGGYCHPRTGERFPITACEVYWHVSGMPIVVMARIDCNPDRDLPSWSGVVDKGQVGWSERTGRFEVYDAGCAPGTNEAQWNAIDITD